MGDAEEGNDIARMLSGEGEGEGESGTDDSPEDDDEDKISLSFSLVIKSTQPVAVLAKDQTFMDELKIVGLKILGLPTDKKDWIDVTLTSASARRLAVASVQPASPISVEYVAKIPKAASSQVHVETDPAT